LLHAQPERHQDRKKARIDGVDRMTSLMTEIWRCVQIAKNNREKIRIHLHPATLYKLIREYTDLFIIENGLMGYGRPLWGVPVIVDRDIVEDSFWIEKVTTWTTEY